MDYFGFDTVKAEKSMAMNKFKRKNKAKKFFRYAVVAASAVLLSWSSVWIPIILQTTALYIRLACTVVASQKFIFFMCNVIILTLAAKSGQLSSGGGSGTPDLYEEYMKNSDNRPKYSPNPELGEEEMEKHCTSEDLQVVPPPEEEKSTVEEETKEIVKAEVTSSNRRKYRRSQSENHERTNQRHAVPLRRSESMFENSETQTQNGGNSSPIIVESINEINDNDDLNKRIEAFISRQYSFQREEGKTVRLAMKEEETLRLVMEDEETTRLAMIVQT